MSDKKVASNVIPSLVPVGAALSTTGFMFFDGNLYLKYGLMIIWPSFYLNRCNNYSEGKV